MFLSLSWRSEAIFFGHRIQGRAGCPSSPSLCSTIRGTTCLWPALRCWSYLPSLEAEGFHVFASSQGSRTKKKMRAFRSTSTCTLACLPLPKTRGFMFTKAILLLHLVATPKHLLPLWGSCRGPQTQLTESLPPIWHRVKHMKNYSCNWFTWFPSFINSCA